MSSPLGSGGGECFLCHQPGRGGGGVTAKIQEPGWGNIRGGEDDFRQSSRGELLYHDKLLVFP